MPLVKLLIGMWILAPQFKGEFFIYHFLIEYLLQFEHYILNIRCQSSSNIVFYSQIVSHFILKKTITFLSEECIVNKSKQHETFEHVHLNREPDAEGDIEHTTVITHVDALIEIT